MTGADTHRPAAAPERLSYSPNDRPPAEPFAHDSARPIPHNAGPFCRHYSAIAYIPRKRSRWEEPPDERDGSPLRARRSCFPCQERGAVLHGTGANGCGSERQAGLLRSVPRAILHAWAKQGRFLRMGTEYAERSRRQHLATSRATSAEAALNDNRGPR